MLKKLYKVWDNSLDIRETRDGRWMDQKVTPDVLSAICGVVAYETENGAQDFTIKNLWESPEFERNVRRDFDKPHPRNPRASSEYDKFVGQPVKALAAASVLNVAGIKPQIFSVAKGMNGVVGDIAGSERKAIEFLDAYVYESLSQSGMASEFDNFFNKQTRASFSVLKKAFAEFTVDNTNINGVKECNRIFPKVLNILAYTREKKGTVRGRLSSNPIGLLDIRYNRLNFRDTAQGKPKKVPRQQYEKRPDLLSPKGGGKMSRSARRVIDDVKKHHKNKPEIKDEFSATPNSARGVEGHHIFPRSEYPNLSLLRENIILLTPTQHKGHAHADSSHAVSAYYQHFCLQKKLRAVQECQNDPNCQFYSFDIFKGMLFEAGVINASHGVTNAKKLTALLPDDVERIMHEHYGAE